MSERFWLTALSAAALQPVYMYVTVHDAPMWVWALVEFALCLSMWQMGAELGKWWAKRRFG